MKIVWVNHAQQHQRKLKWKWLGLLKMTMILSISVDTVISKSPKVSPKILSLFTNRYTEYQSSSTHFVPSLITPLACSSSLYSCQMLPLRLMQSIILNVCKQNINHFQKFSDQGNQIQTKYSQNIRTVIASVCRLGMVIPQQLIFQCRQTLLHERKKTSEITPD